ncbi:hypothetical protein I4U23_009966 [Adineta vaga]|nr:hypothetical protein I4U23_009966 [Adineta vaga]
MDPPLEFSFDTISLTSQQQPSLTLNLADGDNLDQLLGDCPPLTDFPDNNVSTDFSSNNDDIQFDINALIHPSDDPNNITSIETQFSRTSIDDNNAILELLESYTSNDPLQPSTFTEQIDFSEIFSPPPASVSVGNSPVEPKANDISYDAQDCVNEQDRLYRRATQSKNSKRRQQRPTTVAPVDYYINSGACEPCTSQVQSDYVYQQQSLQYDTFETKKIRILAQPRSKFRPRTHNESKNSSHYVRCEDGVKPEHPTIAIPQEWNFHAEVNFIEVAWVGLDKASHPYTLHNKNSSETLEDHVMIFKQHEPNIIYFRLTNEDFLNGYKTFMFELIKSKQDEFITKELIRTRQLEHSMLRFTRVFQLGKGDYLRDEGSVEYSTVMSEGYGEVDVEHMGPRYGPMSGQEMIYMVLKGRILKNDLKIEITEPSFGWTYPVSNFTKNGNVVYFLMPAFPYQQYGETIKVNIIVYYKDEEIAQNIYLYKKSLDEELAALHLNDSQETTSSSLQPNNFNAFDLINGTDILLNSVSKKASATKRTTKRLNNKQK